MSNQIWKLFVPKQAVGASLEYFDLFNAAGSGQKVEISSVKIVVSGAVAVTGVLGVDLFLLKTTSIGTGGTAATLQGSSITAATFTTVVPPPGALPSGVSARLTPTGGAADGAIVGMDSVFPEETNSGTYNNKELVNENIILDENSGIMVFQGAVASVGNIGFLVTFGLMEK